MKKVMFVCHGNICRSPMAEFIFKDMLKKEGLSDKYTVSSSATSTEEIPGGVGNPIYPPAKAELGRRNIPFEDRRAVQLTRGDYGKYDLFLAMDSKNLRNIYLIFGKDTEGKVKKLLDFTGGGDVADPWYSGNFEKAYNDIYDGCKALLGYLEGEE